MPPFPSPLSGPDAGRKTLPLAPTSGDTPLPVVLSPGDTAVYGVALAERLAHLVWVADPDGSVVYVNRRTAEYTGLAGREDIRLDWRRAVHPEDIPLVAAAWDRSARTGEPV